MRTPLGPSRSLLLGLLAALLPATPALAAPPGLGDEPATRGRRRGNREGTGAPEVTNGD